MQKTKGNGNLNVLIFDDEQPSMRATQQPRATNSSKNIQLPPSQHQYEVIQQEIQLLAQKILKLEQQTDNIGLSRNESNFTSKNSFTNIEGNGGFSKQILMAIQKKIQLIVKETKKIVQKLSDTFQKKIQGKLSKKYDETGLTRVKQTYASAVKKVQEGYKREIQRLSKEYRQAQSKMIKRVQQIEDRLLNKIREFEVKQKEYIDWIHHLQTQIKQRQQKSKKMIEVTQERPNVKKQMIESSSVMTQHNNNVESYNFSSVNPQKGSITQIDNKNDNSRVNRKHKIFENAHKASSVSPNHKTVSPNSDFVGQNPAPLYSTKVINPTIKVKIPQPELQKPTTISLATKVSNPLKNNLVIDDESSPWKVIDKSIQKSYEINTKRNGIVKDVNEDEFYKDLPKANVGWERFQDFKQNDASSSDSEDDVLFYREGDRHQQFLQNFKSAKNKDDPAQIQNIFGQSKKTQNAANKQLQQKVFSPFDLN